MKVMTTLLEELSCDKDVLSRCKLVFLRSWLEVWFEEKSESELKAFWFESNRLLLPVIESLSAELLVVLSLLSTELLRLPPRGSESDFMV